MKKKCVYSLIRLFDAILKSTFNIPLFYRRSKRLPKLSPFASWPGTIINPQWLELSMSRAIFHGPKDVRAIETLLYYDELKAPYSSKIDIS